MRIAMLSYHTCPLATLGGKDTGGMNVYVRDLTRVLGQMGVQVDVFTRSQDEHVPHVLHDLGYGNRVVHVPAGPETPLPRQEWGRFLPEFVQGVVRFGREKSLHYDLIHSHYWLSGLAALSLKEVWSAPIVHMFHTLGVMKQRVRRGKEEAESDERIQGELRVLRGADRIVAATLAEVAQLQWLYQADVNKIAVNPPGVDLTRFYPIPPEEAKEFIGVPPCNRMLLFVGRIEPLKGIDALLEAIRIMRLKGVDVCLAVIGGNPESGVEETSTEMERLKSLRDQAGLTDLVAFLGKRSQDTLPYYYSAAEAVVMPSQYESFGMVALEAMACGAPVVASQVGGLAYLVQDGVTGFIVPVDDPRLLAEKLIRIVEDPGLRQQLGSQAAHIAKEYGWEKIGARIIELYHQALFA